MESIESRRQTDPKRQIEEGQQDYENMKEDAISAASAELREWEEKEAEREDARYEMEKKQAEDEWAIVLAESEQRLERATEQVKELLKLVEGKFIGTRHYARYQGGWTSNGALLPMGEGGENIYQIAESLAERGKLSEGLDSWSGQEPIYDDSVYSVGASSGDGDRFKFFLGKQEIATTASPWRNHWVPGYHDPHSPNHILGKRVTDEVFSKFIENARRMASEAGQEAGRTHELPEQIQVEVNKIKGQKK